MTENKDKSMARKGYYYGTRRDIEHFLTDQMHLEFYMHSYINIQGDRNYIFYCPGLKQVYKCIDSYVKIRKLK